MLNNANMKHDDMRCEEFEMMGLDPLRDPSLGDELRDRVAQHAQRCSRCSALAASWYAAQSELSALADFTRDAGQLAVIENRLLQQFRLKHQSRRERRNLQFATWALAAAAVLVMSLSIWGWHNWKLVRAGNFYAGKAADSSSVMPQRSGTASQTRVGDIASSDSDTLMASNSSENDFTQLPGASAQALDDASILHVGMQRSSLAALGLPVNEDHADDWIQVDLLVGSDGSPQAVRMPQ